MQIAKPALLLLLLAVAAGGLLWFFWSDAGAAAPGVLGGGTDATAAAATLEGAGTAPAGVPSRAAAPRAAVAAARPDSELDPSIAAALCGFRGRVIDHTGQPLPAQVVELMRFAFDSVLDSGAASASPFGALVEPQFDAGRALTDSGGEFAITGVWPQAFYVLFAGVGGDNPRMVIVDRTPGPGEILDLGDIQIELAATVVGVVVDGDDEPIGGALVRAADVPGVVLTMVPVERLDPAGALIIYEESFEMVVSFPSWFPRMFERLPIPRTTTAADGSFRLTGVVAGNNLVAVTAPARLSFVQPRLRLKAGEERDIGRVVLKEGEEAWGRVVDHKDQPIAGAQVLVGQVAAVGPAAFASHAEPTNDKGEFSLTGFRGGKVIAAARREAGDAWTIGEPQPVARDLIIRLPGRHRITVRVLAAAGTPIENAEFRLVAGGGQMAAAVRTGMLGMQEPIDLEDRLSAIEPGAWLIDDLTGGEYQLLVSAPGHQVAAQEFELTADVERTFKLAPYAVGVVTVVDTEDRPIRAAAVYAGPSDRPGEMPLMCGRTDDRGAVEVQQLPAGEVSITVFHPGYGWAQADATLPAEDIRVVLQAPGAVHGVLTEDGGTPPLGKYMILAVHSSLGRVAAMPRLTAPDARGRFEINGVQPGELNLTALPSSRAIRSPGSIFKMVQTAWMFGGNRGGNASVEVASGAIAETRLDLRTEPDPIEGPSANLSGTVFVNGRPARGMVVNCWASARRSVEVDQTGRFDLGRVAASAVSVQVHDVDSGLLGAPLWSESLTVEANRDVDLAIEMSMGAVAGRVVLPAGGRAGRCELVLRGAPEPAGGGKRTASIRIRSASDDVGVFRFDRVPAGLYELQADSTDGRARLPDIRVLAGLPTEGLEVALRPTFTVSGTIDGRVFGELEPKWIWVHWMPESGETKSATSDGTEDLSFSVRGVAAGRYRVRLTAYFAEPVGEGRAETIDYVHDGVLQVDRNRNDVVLRPVLPAPEQKDPAEARRGAGKRSMKE